MKTATIILFTLFLISCNNQNRNPESMSLEHVLYEELTPTEFRKRIAESPVAYLPLGTIEWHGEHLPLGSDGLQSKGFFELLAREAGGVVYPMMFMGPDRQQVIDEKQYYGMDYSVREENSEFYYPAQQLDGSSYWISDEDFKVIMEATLKQIKRAGFKVLVAHGHGPSTNFLREHTGEWEERFGLKIIHCWGYKDQEGMGIMVDHAAMNETSLVMALRPDLVHMEYLPEDTATWPLGVSGQDPRLYASKEKGAEIISIQKERMVGIIRDLLVED